jgi:hypothetical protein
VPNKLVFSASAASLKEEVTPEGEKGMSMGGTHLTRESSKIHTLATHCRKWCPGPQNRTPWSQNGAPWSQNEPTIVAKVIKTSHKYDTDVIWHGGGSGSACDSGYIYIYIYIYIYPPHPRLRGEPGVLRPVCKFLQDLEGQAGTIHCRMRTPSRFTFFFKIEPKTEPPKNQPKL